MAISTALEFSRHLKNIPARLTDVASCYLLALAVKSPKHTQTFASELSGLDRSQFSRLLSRHQDVAVESLDDLSRSATLDRAQERRPLVASAPWKVALLIDATLHGRSSLHVQNAQRFNHGEGFVIGHQWTNVALVINDELVALPPISFISKNESKRRGIAYKTEHEHVLEYLRALNLLHYLGEYSPSEIVVILDSGYDNKKVQKAILGLGYDFVVNLKCTRSVKTFHAPPGKTRGWKQIRELFRRCRRYAPWKTVRTETKTAAGKTKRRKYCVRRLEGYLKGVICPIILLCSKKSKGDGVKYLACSNLTVSTSAILQTYILRWRIELFHRDVKQNLGMLDAGVECFESQVSHVHWVYCAYLLLRQMDAPAHLASIHYRQLSLGRKLEARKLKGIVQLSTRFDGARQVRGHCRGILEDLRAA